MNNRLPQYMSPLPDPKALAVNALAVSWDGMNALNMHVICIPSNPSHSGGAEQGDDGQGSPMSDRTLLTQPSMVSNSTRVVDRPPQEAPQGITSFGTL
jgi:hypothetical protein